MTAMVINKILEKVTSFQYAIMDGWIPFVIKFENQFLVADLIVCAIGLWIFGVHNIPASTVDKGEVTEKELKFHRRMQVKGAIICGIGIILISILGTASIKNM